MKKLLIAVLTILLLTGCGLVRSSPGIDMTTTGYPEVTQATKSKELTDPSPSAPLLLTDTSTASLPTRLPTLSSLPSTITPLSTYTENCNGMTPAPLEKVTRSNQILYYEYEYFQLEGVPPYPSPYVKMVASDKYWVDMADPNRSRFERSYHTQTSDPKEGFERIDIGTGTGGVFEDCQFYEGKETCSQRPITSTLTIDDWVQFQTSMADKFLANQNTPELNAGYAFKGCQRDEIWGEAYIFERTTPLVTSDLYANYPSIEIRKFDVAMKRATEWKRTVMDGEKMVIHDDYRLIKWEWLDRYSIPQDLFTPRQK